MSFETKLQTEDEQLELLYLGFKELITFEKEPENIFLKKIYGIDIKNELLEAEARRLFYAIPCDISQGNIPPDVMYQREVATLLLGFSTGIYRPFEYYYDDKCVYSTTEEIGRVIDCISHDRLFQKWTNPWSFPNLSGLSEKEKILKLRVASLRNCRAAEMIYERYPCALSGTILFRQYIESRKYEEANQLAIRHNINFEKYINTRQWMEKDETYHSLKRLNVELLTFSVQILHERLRKMEEQNRELLIHLQYMPGGEGARKAEIEFRNICDK